MAKTLRNGSLQSDDQTLDSDPLIDFAPLIDSNRAAISSAGSSLQAAAGGLITAPGQASLSAAASDSAGGPINTWTVGHTGGLMFVNAFTSNVTDPDEGLAYEAAIDAAENYLQAEFTNPVTVNVAFDLNALTTANAGNNPKNLVVNWSDLYNALANHATSTDQKAAVTALQSLADPSNGHGFEVTYGMARMLGGLGIGPPPAFSGTTTQNWADDTVTLNPILWNPITLSSDISDAQAAIEHELSEGIMGRLGSLGFASSVWAPMDLFRFTSMGVRDFSGSYNTPTYFSPDGNNVYTGLQYHTLDPSGKYNGDDKSTSPDLADWDTAGDDANQHDPFGPGGPLTGSPGTLSPTDLSIMDVLGWTRADLPDLIVSSITPVTTSVPEGTDLSFSYVIKNQGGGAAGLSEEAWQVDAQPTPTSFLGPDTLSSLAGGATASFSDSISTAGLSFGPHTLYVEANADGEINESNVTNNVLSIPFMVTGPDLVVSSITSTSTSVPRGASLNFSYVIKNQGTLPAGLSEEAWQVDAQPTPTSPWLRHVEFAGSRCNPVVQRQYLHLAPQRRHAYPLGRRRRHEPCEWRSNEQLELDHLHGGSALTSNCRCGPDGCTCRRVGHGRRSAWRPGE